MVGWLILRSITANWLAGWLEELSEYDMVIQHRAGNKHVNADALSRISLDTFCPNLKSSL